jgi:hypothetical protein
MSLVSPGPEVLPGQVDSLGPVVSPGPVDSLGRVDYRGLPVSPGLDKQSEVDRFVSIKHLQNTHASRPYKEIATAMAISHRCCSIGYQLHYEAQV